MTFDPRLPHEDGGAPRAHPLAEAAWLVAGAAVAGVLLTALAIGVADVASRWLPATVEARLFGGAFAPEGDHPRAPAARDVLARLAAHWPENPYAFRLSVTDLDAPNAFALPGGLVVVTRGLLEQVESENELAFVLGHEIGHFAGRDHLQALGRALVLSLGLQALLGFAGVDADVPAVASRLAERGYGRGQERAADRFGLALVAAEYGHVAGADAFFARLPDAEARFGRRAAAWFATHPVTATRIERLRAHAAERGWRADGPLTPLRGAGSAETSGTSGDGPEWGHRPGTGKRSHQASTSARSASRAPASSRRDSAS